MQASNMAIDIVVQFFRYTKALRVTLIPSFDI